MLIYLSPTVQVDILKHATAPFPLKNPGIVSIPLSFLVGAVVSLVSREPEAEAGFAEAERRMQLGATGSLVQSAAEPVAAPKPAA